MVQPSKVAMPAAAECFRLPGFDVRVGTHAAATSLPRHEHELPSICCVQQGRFTEHYPGKSVACDPRMVKVTPAGEPHWNRFEGVDTLGLRIDVDARRFRELPAVARLLEERRFFQANVFDGLARRLLAEVTAPDECAGIAAEALLLELLVQLARMPWTDTPPREEWLRRADEIVHDTFRSGTSVSSIAAAVGVHPTTLARAYRRAYGCTVGERARSLRLDHAARGLLDAHRTLSRVAMDAGFYDQSHFTRAFQRQFRMTPLQYRRRFTA
jgi:AraC family transcriptional regulator